MTRQTSKQTDRYGRQGQIDTDRYGRQDQIDTDTGRLAHRKERETETEKQR